MRSFVPTVLWGLYYPLYTKKTGLHLVSCLLYLATWLWPRHPQWYPELRPHSVVEIILSIVHKKSSTTACFLLSYSLLRIRYFLFFVASPGIEPGSGASETHILSIVLRGQYFNKLSIFNIKSYSYTISASGGYYEALSLKRSKNNRNKLNST